MKHLLDSNVIIYAAEPGSGGSPFRQWVLNPDAAVSALSQVEVLGFHSLDPTDAVYFQLVFSTLPLLSVTNAVLLRAVFLRQQFRLKTPDAIVAATALEYGLELVTSDRGFTRVSGLVVLDPLFP